MYFSEDYHRWVIVGITSSGDSCGTIPQVRVYTRLSMYINWIQSIVGRHGAIFIDEHRSSAGAVPPARLIDEANSVDSSAMSKSRMLVSLLFPCLFFSNFLLAHIYQ